jgi:tetratricopeptide (TPR) repeat protein
MLDKFIRWGIPKIYLDDAYYLKGQILEDIGNKKEALECYYKVLTLAPPRSIYARKAKERISELEKK